jgi:hypothetical protein
MAEQAIETNPSGFDGHIWAAATIGEWSRGIGILKALTKGLGKKLEGHLKDAERTGGMERNCYSTSRIWGRYYYKLPWPKYDAEKSLKFLSDAVAKCPDKARSRLYYADTLWKEDKKDEAQAQLDALLAIDCGKDDDPSDCQRQKNVARTKKEEWK